MILNSQIGFEDVESVREKRSFLRKDRVPVSSRGVGQPGVSIRHLVDDSSILIIPRDRWATSSDANRRSSFRGQFLFVADTGGAMPCTVSYSAQRNHCFERKHCVCANCVNHGCVSPSRNVSRAFQPFRDPSLVHTRFFGRILFKKTYRPRGQVRRRHFSLPSTLKSRIFFHRNTL